MSLEEMPLVSQRWGHRIKGANLLGAEGERGGGVVGSLTMHSFPGGEAKYNSEGTSEVINRESFFVCLFVFVKADIYGRLFHVKMRL